MTAANSTPRFDADTTLGAIVAARPTLARVFERLGLDYCCGGKQSLATACRNKDLDPAAVLRMVEEAAAASDAGPAEVDAAAMSLTDLADHIVQTHHTYVKSALPSLLEMAARVSRKHSWRDERLLDVFRGVTALTEEMFQHMQKEEIILFPLVRQIDAGATDGFHCGSIANPIRVMEAEHEVAGQVVARLRELTDGFTPNAESCTTHRAMLAGLAEFEGDLHRHVHKENNLLFPRALARAGGG